ncbi:LysR family transcriptional regulator [Tsukamurella pseudospumae]|uniref:LysR family transcriptional regulator n=1 Tax=Tsukamurella pseudospumae TaxID=239498 RepID=UPI0009EA89B1|nr:LysR family transcriptional regulator [Tsukamurella pseudospumae]
MASARLDQISVLHLRYYLAVVEEGTIRAAAARIGISQPSLSQQLSRLEKHVGTSLLRRSHTGVIPTPAGLELADIADETIRALGRLGTPRPHIQLGVPRGTRSTVLTTLLSKFGADVEFVQLDTAKSFAALRHGDVHAAAVRGPVADHGDDDAGLRVSLLDEVPLGVLVGSNSPLASRTAVTARDLAGHRLCWFDERRAPLYAESIERWCGRHGWQPALVVMDPGGAGLHDDALRRHPDLVALRPADEMHGEGVSWLPLADPPTEQIYLIEASARRRS